MSSGRSFRVAEGKQASRRLKTPVPGKLPRLPQFLRRPSLYEPAGGWLTPRILISQGVVEVMTGR